MSTIYVWGVQKILIVEDNGHFLNSFQTYQLKLQIRNKILKLEKLEISLLKSFIFQLGNLRHKENFISLRDPTD